MAAVQTETCCWNTPWDRGFHLYKQRPYNPLMDGLWSDWTPLHEAALQGRLLLLRTLLSQRFSACSSTVNGVTALHEACAGGHLGCAKTLLEYGADADAVTIDGATPLFNACCSGNPALVSLILKHSSAPHPAHLLASPIHEAAKRGHITCVELLLANGVNVDLELEAGTPLYCACETQRTDCVHTLLLLGADVNRGRGLDTPLHAAARVGGAREVELLLEHGADGNCRNSEGKRAVELAEQHSEERLILQSAGPCSLSQLCRQCIRRSLGQHRLNRTHALYLPNSLHNYLLYR
ncbi:ankyrin repeat and SOCS box protein 11 [Clupea harengus]|uniref:Ankyrin repeat and SOCS box protein 11 n=1 Tax=Clupea harengus TaxID=7950 RepID=A0A6P8GBZ4_CLUHA|nr:ankyrin repeat and SOCS box protein 11 [Clupea harengus]